MLSLSDIKTIGDLLLFCNQNPWMIMILLSVAIVIIPTWIGKTITSKLKGHDESIISQVSLLISSRFICIEDEIKTIKQDQSLNNETTNAILENCKQFNKCKTKKPKVEKIRPIINTSSLTDIQAGLA